MSRREPTPRRPARFRTPSPSPSPSSARRVPRLEPGSALALLGGMTESVAVGFEPDVEHLKVHLLPLPQDERAAAAGLFTLVVPRAWCAVGAVLAGTAKDLRTGDTVGHGAAARVVVTRDGQITSELLVDGVDAAASIEPPADAPSNPSGDPAAAAGPPEGVVVDALHRLLELPCPGEAPPLHSLVLGLWLVDVLRLALDGRTLRWHEALDLHPGEPGSAQVAPSVETVIEATTRAAHELDWDRLRRLAARGRARSADLSPEEAAWMDATMFGRWVLSGLPDPALVIALLRETGSVEAADGIDAVRRGLLLAHERS